MKTQTVASTLIVILLIAVCSNLALSSATQPRSDWIEVTSPQNNYVYPSGDVWLNFTSQNSIDVNYSSYSINLDGQMQNIAGNQTFHILNLSAGSHKLEIYGNISTGYFANQTELLSIVYFSVNYSSNWVTFIMALSIVVVVLSVLLFVKRRQITMRLKGKKNGLFWLGLTLVILASFIVVPLGYSMLNCYLFPFYDYLLVRVLSDPFVYGGLAVIGIGVLLIALGTMQPKNPKDAKV
jgi:hypothetical protein